MFYTTTNGEPSGAASPAYEQREHAEQHASAANDKAERMGVSARYTVAETDNPEEIGWRSKKGRDDFPGFETP